MLATVKVPEASLVHDYAILTSFPSTIRSVPNRLLKSVLRILSLSETPDSDRRSLISDASILLSVFFPQCPCFTTTL
jgi:hypothetical protein